MGKRSRAAALLFETPQELQEEPESQQASSSHHHNNNNTASNNDKGEQEEEEQEDRDRAALKKARKREKKRLKKILKQMEETERTEQQENNQNKLDADQVMQIDNDQSGEQEQVAQIQVEVNPKKKKEKKRKNRPQEEEDQQLEPPTTTTTVEKEQVDQSPRKKPKKKRNEENREPVEAPILPVIAPPTPTPTTQQEEQPQPQPQPQPTFVSPAKPRKPKPSKSKSKKSNNSTSSSTSKEPNPVTATIPLPSTTGSPSTTTTSTSGGGAAVGVDPLFNFDFVPSSSSNNNNNNENVPSPPRASTSSAATAYFERGNNNNNNDNDEEEDLELPTPPAEFYQQAEEGGGKKKKNKKKQDKGKGKGKEKVSENDDSATKKKSTTTTTTTLVPISPPRPIRIGPPTNTSSTSSTTLSNSTTDPLKPKHIPPSLTGSDSDVESLTTLEQDPEFVKPPQRNGPFWNLLQTKWIPVKELKNLAHEHGGQVYKQGKFSNSEDRLIKATIKNFREKMGWSFSELLEQINSKKSSTPTNSKGKGKAAVEGVSNANTSGGIGEMWLDLGFALQERALLSIWNRVKRMYNPDSGKGPWTPSEDSELKLAIKEFGSSSWEKISTKVGRPSGDCRDRWIKQLGGGNEDKVKKGKWSKEEEEELIRLHKELGNSWTAIVKRMGGTRTATQCRIKWNDSLARKAAAGDTPEASTSTGAAKSTTNRGDDESEEEEQEEGGEEASENQGWKWKPENYSTLVHVIANMKVKNESEIDFATIDEPTLEIQGIKNLRDRFKRLRQGAIIDIRERDNLGPEIKVPWQSIIEHLLELYPESGKAYKRTYRLPEKRRLEKLKLKEERKKVREEKARLREQGISDGKIPPPMSTRRSGKFKSDAIVRDSDDEDEDEGGSSE